MPLRRPRFPNERDPHVATRTLACLAASLLVVLAAVKLWPPREPEPPAAFDVTPVMLDPMEIVEIQPTQQPPPPANLPPPPPELSDPDLPPVEVEDIIDVEELEVTPFDVDIPTPEARVAQPSLAPPVPSSGPPSSAPAAGPGRTPAATGPRLVRQPDQAPRYRFAPLPEYPEAARRAGVRARAVVEVLVTEGGRVGEAEIVERALLRGDNATRVASLPNGLDQVALATARRYVFSPAKHGGRIVQTYMRVTFTFGDD